MISYSRKRLNDYAKSLFSGLGDRLTTPINYRDGMLGLLLGGLVLSNGCGQNTGYEYPKITITADSTTNRPPVANDDSATTYQDIMVSMNVLVNDVDADLDSLNIQSFTQPANGAVVQNANNLEYTPNASFLGSDSFTYTVSDGVDTDTANVFISVMSSAIRNNDIVFSSTRTGNWEVYSMDVDGNNQLRLTYTNNFEDLCPSWSPDGTRIAYYSVRENYGIYIMNADGTDEIKLGTSLVNTSSPNWSPDGTKIAVHGNMGGQNDIYVINIDGTGEQKLTDNPGHDCEPSFSPDGAKIVYNAEKDGMYVMNSDGSNKQKLIDLDGNSYPEWSPDGNTIVFAMGGICLIKPDGAGLNRLGSGEAPCWSPDGDKIMFHSDGIYVMNSDGGNVQRLTNGPDYYPDWKRNKL